MSSRAQGAAPTAGSGKGKRLKGLAADIKRVPPLILLGVAEAVKYGHKFKIAKKVGQIAFRYVKDDESNLKGLALLSLGHASWAVSNYPQAETQLREAKTLLEKMPPGPLQAFYLMRSILLLGDTVYNLDHADEAETLARDAHTLIQKCRADSAEGPLLHRWARKTRIWSDFCILSMVELGELYYYTSCWDEGEKLLRELVPILIEREGKQDGRTIEAQRDLASMLVNQDKYEDAEQAYRLAREWHEESPTFGREEQGAIDYNIAMCLSEQGKHAEAKEELKRLNVAEDVFHYANGDWTLKLARTTHLRLGEHEEVVALCRRFEDVLDGKFGKTNEVTMRNLADLVLALFNLKKFGEAVPVLRDMRAREDSDPSADIWQVLETQRNLAHALRLSCQHDESAYQFRKCLEKAAAENWSNTDSGVRDCLENLAYLYEKTDDKTNAMIAYSKLHSSYLGIPRTEFHVMKYLWFRGKVFMIKGELGRACVLFRRALEIIICRKRILRERQARKNDQPKPTEKEPDHEVVVIEVEREGGEAPARTTPKLPQTLSALEEKFKIPDPEKEESTLEEMALQPPEQRNDGNGHIKSWYELIWWDNVIRGAISAALACQVFQSPAPAPHVKMYGSWDMDETEDEVDETVDTYISRLAKYPYAPRSDDWDQEEFVTLPDTYEEFSRPKKDEEWERFLFGSDD